jgi:hypothetical protein
MCTHPDAETLEFRFYLLSGSHTDVLDRRHDETDCPRRARHAPGCCRMPAQKYDGFDLTRRAKHGATISAVENAGWIFPGKKHGVELGQEDDCWRLR